MIIALIIVLIGMANFASFMNTKKKPTYINPLLDFGFKKLFGEEINDELLMDLLSAIVPDMGRITKIDYHPTEQLGTEAEDRKAVFDIYCTNEKGEHFIVEMQKAQEPHFIDRSLFYSAFLLRKQAPKGDWDFGLKAVFFVGILDFDCFDGDKYIETVHLVRDSTGERFSDKLNFVYVVLPKFKKTLEELETNADRWLYCLKNMATLDSQPPEVQGKVFELLFDAARINKLKKEEMETYDKSVLEYASVRRCADFAMEQGIQKGRQEGMEKGMEKGRQEGIQEGVQKGIFFIEKKMKEEGASLEFIVRTTGLTPEELSKLQGVC
jgi:predicted transposase/invertase (TIGR01784 family)